MRSICDYQKTRFFDSFKPIYRHVIGMRKKILFKVKYVRVYLMLNALCVKPIDYKSIALPAELQGHPMLSRIFIAKAQINQCIKRSALMLAAVAARRFVQGCGPFVPNLSSWLSSWGSDLNQDFISSFNFIKTIKTWSGIYENYEVNKVYKS